MFDKKIILKILAAIAITYVYSSAAFIIGNCIAGALLPLSGAFIYDNEVLTCLFCLAPPVLLFAAVDNMLFDRLCRLFERPALVYAVLSGNFITLRWIYAMIYAAASAGENDFGLSVMLSLLLVVPVICLLGGVLFCFLIRLYRAKMRKAKENDGNVM